VAWLGALTVRILGSTWRISRHGHDPLSDRRADAPRCIFAFWHSALFPLTFTHRGRGGAVLIGRHLDAEIVARVIEHLGFVSARGSSTRGGEQAALEMLAFAAAGRFLGLTPDGPRGPAEMVKPGLAFLASRSGLPVLPLGVGCASAWGIGSWDRLRVPRPLSRVHLEFGAAIAVPPGLDDLELEPWRVRIESALRDTTRMAREAAGEPV
jgi:lysophospholipid acyltransferase (LPLAT)-like uncharacterized protein